MDESERAFHLEEYKVVRQRLQESFIRFQRVTWVAAIGSITVFSFLVIRDVREGYAPLVAFGWLLPFFLTLFLRLQSRVYFRQIKLYSSYSERLEAALGSSALPGWEKFFRAAQSSPGLVRTDPSPDAAEGLAGNGSDRRAKDADLWSDPRGYLDRRLTEFYEGKKDEPWHPGTLLQSGRFLVLLLLFILVVGVLGAVIALSVDPAAAPQA